MRQKEIGQVKRILATEKFFLDIYFIMSGHGTIQWKTDGGETREQKVGPGDTVYTPADVVEHQLLNTGSEKIHMAVVGVPPSRRTPLG